jgi:hypothetical protein
MSPIILQVTSTNVSRLICRYCCKLMQIAFRIYNSHLRLTQCEANVAFAGDFATDRHFLHGLKFGQANDTYNIKLARKELLT